MPIRPLITDLEQIILPYQQFDAIVISRYLDLNLFKAIENALKPCGLLFYQTFLGHVQNNAPPNPKFYIQTDKFNHALSNLKTEVYGEGWLKNENSKIDAIKNCYAWYVGLKAL